MLKFYVILSILLIGAMGQDMPPPELEPPPTTTTTTPEPSTEPPTIEPIPEITTTTTPEPITEPAIPEPTPEVTSVEPDTTTTTKSPEDDLSQRPITDSPFIPSSTTKRYPYYPIYPDFGNRKCYYKKQYGHPRWQISCNRWQYIYPVECYYCCLYQYATFAGCYRVHAYNCKATNQYHYY